MNSYQILKEKHSKEFDQFPMVFAFNNEQFKEAMEKLGLKETDTDKVYKSSIGGIYRKTNSKLLKTMIDRQCKEIDTAIANDTDGTGFILDMFDYELSNHEYSYTYELEDTLDALALTIEEVNESPALLNGLEQAIKLQG